MQIIRWYLTTIPIHLFKQQAITIYGYSHCYTEAILTAFIHKENIAISLPYSITWKTTQLLLLLLGSNSVLSWLESVCESNRQSLIRIPLKPITSDLSNCYNINLCCPFFFRKHTNISLCFNNYQHWDGTVSHNPSLWKSFHPAKWTPWFWMTWWCMEGL